MKKNKETNNNLKYTIILIVCILISLVSLFYLNYEPKIKIINDKKIWDAYDKNLENVKTIMDSITTDSDTFFWWDLENVNIKDKQYKSLLSSLVADIRMVYLNLTDSDLYTYSNIMSNYRNKDFIYKEDLIIISEGLEYNRVKLRLDYSSLNLNNDSLYKLMEASREYNELLDTDLFQSNDLDYEDYVLRSYLVSEKLENLSLFLKREYDIYKKK